MNGKYDKQQSLLLPLGHIPNKLVKDSKSRLRVISPWVKIMHIRNLRGSKGNNRPEGQEQRQHVVWFSLTSIMLSSHYLENMVLVSSAITSLVRILCQTIFTPTTVFFSQTEHFLPSRNFIDALVHH